MLRAAACFHAHQLSPSWLTAAMPLPPAAPMMMITSAPQMPPTKRFRSFSSAAQLGARATTHWPRLGWHRAAAAEMTWAHRGCQRRAFSSALPRPPYHWLPLRRQFRCRMGRNTILRDALLYSASARLRGICSLQTLARFCVTD